VATTEQVALRWRPELSYSKELKINTAEVATTEQVALRWRPELSYSKELKINSAGQDNM
jgi:hypothetical protein